jgi:hypothetical protein
MLEKIGKQDKKNGGEQGNNNRFSTAERALTTLSQALRTLGVSFHQLLHSYI